MAQHVTTLSRRWIIKIVVFVVLAAGIGLWGVYDFWWAYPNRGERHSAFMLRDYLSAADTAGRIRQVSVDDPRQTLDDLRSRKEEIGLQANAEDTSRAAREARMERAKLAWLESLNNMWRLDSAGERIEDNPRAQLSALEQRLAQENQPKPLSSFDMAFQWVFIIVGFGAALWNLQLLARMVVRKFRWDDEQLRLTLPGGASFTPDEVTEVDKSKWDRFYATIRLSNGDAHKLDLLRFSPLESWVVEIDEIVKAREGEDDADSAEVREEAVAAGSEGGDAEGEDLEQRGNANTE